MGAKQVFIQWRYRKKWNAFQGILLKREAVGVEKRIRQIEREINLLNRMLVRTVSLYYVITYCGIFDSNFALFFRRRTPPWGKSIVPIIGAAYIGICSVTLVLCPPAPNSVYAAGLIIKV